jgi:hypothetical protein
LDKITYLNLDIRCERLSSGYRARLTASPVGGEASVQLLLPGDFQVFSEPYDLPALKDAGGRLFGAIFHSELLAYLRRSQDTARQQSARLRIRLNFADVPELGLLPWETLFDPAFSHFFALSTDTPVVRYLDLPVSAQPLQVEPPLRILVAIANPADYPALDTEQEWQLLSQSVSDLVQQGLIQLTRLTPASLSELQRLLRREAYHVFHFIGHGEFDDQSGEGFLVMDGEQDRGQVISGLQLGTLLHDHPSLRLVVLNACHGAAGSVSSPFTGVAGSLAQRGIPAVLAMRGEITDQAAISFSSEFYAALADGYPVDAALSESRKAIFSQGNPSEWSLPALFMRSDLSLLFGFSGRHPSKVKSKTPPRVYNRTGGRTAQNQTIIPTEKSDAPALDSADLEVVQDIRRQLDRNRLALFCGADLPERLTDLPDRYQAAQRLIQQESLPEDLTLPEAAQQAMKFGNRRAFIDVLVEIYDTTAKSPQVFHRLVVDLVQRYSVESLFTTAYDDLLELAFKEAGAPLNVAVSDEDLKFIRTDRPTLMKLYGDLRQVTSLVVTTQDQNGLLRGRLKPELVDELRRAMRRNSLLFLGYDLSDPSVSAWFDEIAGERFQLTSYAVWNGLSRAEEESYQGNRGLVVIDADPVAVLEALASA